MLNIKLYLIQLKQGVQLWALLLVEFTSITKKNTTKY